MEKSKFEGLVNKYNLGGSCESVLLSVSGNLLNTTAITDDKNVLCKVVGPAMGLPDGEYPVHETAKLRSLLGVLGENLSPEVQTSGENPTSIKFTDVDSNTVATFVLADKDVIPDVPDVTWIPKTDVQLTLNKQFIQTFIKAKAALSDVDTFTVETASGETDASVILGYSTLNTNRIKLSATKQDVGSSISPISFSAKYLREILVANKDAGDSTLEVSSRGLARVVFDANGVKSEYFLVQIDTSV